MYCTSSKYGGPSYHISRWHLVENTPSILHAPHTLHTCQPNYSPTKTSDSK
jgi:hypothetical protein